MNFILSWILFLFYIFLLLLLCCRSKFCRKDFSAAAGCSLLVMLVVFVSGRCGSREIPRICGEYVMKEGETVSLALYDDSWNMKDVLAFLPDGYCLPLCGWEKRQEIPEGTGIGFCCLENVPRRDFTAVRIAGNSFLFLRRIMWHFRQI